MSSFWQANCFRIDALSKRPSNMQLFPHSKTFSVVFCLKYVSCQSKVRLWLKKRGFVAEFYTVGSVGITS
jgi:hypothetical protein